MRVRCFWAWYDLWIGWYVDRKGRCVYVCPIPTCVVKVSW
jgi:hypothetical protein